MALSFVLDMTAMAERITRGRPTTAEKGDRTSGTTATGKLEETTRSSVERGGESLLLLMGPW